MMIKLAPTPPGTDDRRDRSEVWDHATDVSYSHGYIEVHDHPQLDSKDDPHYQTLLEAGADFCYIRTSEGVDPLAVKYVRWWDRRDEVFRLLVWNRGSVFLMTDDGETVERL